MSGIMSHSTSDGVTSPNAVSPGSAGSLPVHVQLPGPPLLSMDFLVQLRRRKPRQRLQLAGVVAGLPPACELLIAPFNCIFWVSSSFYSLFRACL